MKRDPSDLLSAWGYRLEHHRDRLTAYWHGDERYRLTRTPEGIWQWVDRYGNPGGDLLELMRELDPEIGYAEAAHRLLSPSPTPREPRPVLPPETTQERALGREHLLARGLDLRTLLEAERQGWLRYGAGGLLFLGYDEAGRVRNALWRAIDPTARPRERDLAGSDLRYAPRLVGVEDTVWIVDEGEDALAVHTLARRRFEPPDGDRHGRRDPVLLARSPARAPAPRRPPHPRPPPPRGRTAPSARRMHGPSRHALESAPRPPPHRMPHPGRTG